MKQIRILREHPQLRLKKGELFYTHGYDDINVQLKTGNDLWMPFFLSADTLVAEGFAAYTDFHTIEIEGEEYNYKEVMEAIKDLKPIKL